MKASSCLAGKQLHGTRLLSASVASRACFVDARAGEGCTAVRTKLLEMPGACDFLRNLVERWSSTWSQASRQKSAAEQNVCSVHVVSFVFFVSPCRRGPR